MVATTTSSKPPKSSHYGTGHHRWCTTTTIIIITTTFLVTTTSIGINIIMSVLITTTILVHLFTISATNIIFIVATVLNTKSSSLTPTLTSSLSSLPSSYSHYLPLCHHNHLNFLVKIHIKLSVLQTSRNVLKHMIQKWGGHIWPFHDALRPPQIFDCKRQTETSLQKL